MYDKPGFEIPDQVREIAESNLEQTRAAYNQFMEMARKAQEMATKSQGVMVEGAIEAQSRALKFAEQNASASFELAAELAKAKDLKEYIEVQTKHAQRQMQTFQQQAGELNRLMTDMASKATKG